MQRAANMNPLSELNATMLAEITRAWMLISRMTSGVCVTDLTESD